MAYHPLVLEAADLMDRLEDKQIEMNKSFDSLDTALKDSSFRRVFDLVTRADCRLERRLDLFPRK